MNRLWKAVLWLSTFFFGLFMVLLFINGYRYNPKSGELFPTGVLNISSIPRALLLIDNEIIGETPFALRGVPLKDIDLRFEKGGYESYEKTVSIDPKMVTKVENIFLFPTDFDQRKKVWGAEKDMFWDPEGRGFFWLPNGGAVIFVVDFFKTGVQVKTLPEEGGAISYNTKQKAFLWEKGKQKKTLVAAIGEDLFVSSPFLDIPKTILLTYNEQSPFLFQGNAVYKKGKTSADAVLVAKIEKPIVKMDALSEKGILLLWTADALFVVRNEGTGLRKVADREGAKTEVSLAREEAFWVEDGKVMSIGFGE